MQRTWAAHPEHAAEEQILAVAIDAALDDEACLKEALDDLPVAIYLTDADGFVTFFNRACMALAGREPIVGRDRWCVTWKLYTEDGIYLPHDQCPMARAIRGEAPIRGVIAVAERPDGSRATILPHPTPIFDAEGKLTGAVNLLVDITDRREAERLMEQAARCRRLAKCITDTRTMETLSTMAREYEDQARMLRV